MVVGTLFLRGIKMKWTWFLEYRPALLLLSAAVLIACSIYRLVFLETSSKQLEQIFATCMYVYCVILAILSDFHTEPTKTFRLLVPLLIVVQTGSSVYYDIFVEHDHKVFTIDGHTLGVNSVERDAYCQILFLLIAQLFSLITDPNHSKFFLIPIRCERDEMFLRFSNPIDRGLCDNLVDRETK